MSAPEDDQQPPLETAGWIERAQAGESEAFQNLFERYAPRVRSLVALRMGSRLRDFVELDDLVSEALTDAFRGIERFEMRCEGSFIAWLSRFVQDRIRDTHRHFHAKKRGGGHVVRFGDLSDTLSSALFPGGREPSPSEALAGRELEERLESVMLGLSERYRLAVFYRAVLQMDYGGIAQEMGLKNADTARALCHKALERLQSALGRGD